MNHHVATYARVMAEDVTVLCAACGELTDEHDVCGECRDDRSAEDADPFDGLDTLDEYRGVFEH